MHPDDPRNPYGHLYRRSEIASRTPARTTVYPLSARASQFVETLPPALNPRALRKECPEVLDRLAREWEDPARLARTFDELIYGLPGRGPRLSLAVLVDIANLKHYATVQLRRWRHSVWDDAFDLMR